MVVKKLFSISHVGFEQVLSNLERLTPVEDKTPHHLIKIQAITDSLTHTAGDFFKIELDYEICISRAVDL
jgi:hypothetical protein